MITNRSQPRESLTAAPAIYIGTVAGFRQLPAVELYNLTAKVGEHPIGSTVSRRTLERHGYHVPPLPASHASHPAAARMSFRFVA